MLNVKMDIKYVMSVKKNGMEEANVMKQSQKSFNYGKRTKS